MSVEQRRARGAQLGEVRYLSPAHEPVAVREQLRVSLARGEQSRGMRDLGDERRGEGFAVEAHDDSTRLTAHRGRGAVVEDADLVFGDLARVVLPRRRRTRAHPEARALAAEAPEDMAGARVELIDRPRVARRDQN